MTNTIEVSSFVYRPCLVDDDTKALFHMWVDETSTILSFKSNLTACDKEVLRTSFEKTNVLPYGAGQETLHTLMGLVEFEDGTISKMTPDRIRFLDTDQFMHEQCGAYRDDWIAHVKGEKMGRHKTDPNCQLAKEGKLPPKPKKLSKREVERLIYAKAVDELFKESVRKENKNV